MLPLADDIEPQEFNRVLSEETQASLIEACYREGAPSCWHDFGDMSPDMRHALTAFYTHVMAQPDPRRAWNETGWTPAYRETEHWPVLQLVDFVRTHGATFAEVGGPQHTPGFFTLASDVRTALAALWTLYPTVRPPRLQRWLNRSVHWPTQTIAPFWKIRSDIQRAQLRRRFPHLLTQFAHRGDPNYTSHRSYREEHWPERETWTKAERDYIGHRFFTWDQTPQHGMTNRAAQDAGWPTQHARHEHLWNTRPHGALHG